MDALYVFRCPYHGPETSVFCFRAFTEENIHLWKKYYRIRYEKVEFEEGEKEKLIHNLLHPTP